MRTFKLAIAYDGTRYHGWQRQKGQTTVQEVMEEGLAKIFGEPLSITASGRTDAGVHALGQVVSFSSGGRIPLQNIVAAARGVLPDDIAVLSAHLAPEGFNARFDALGKRYIYRIVQSGKQDPFRVNYTWLLGEKLDIAKMQSAAQYIIGTHDFSSFQASGSTPTQPERTVSEALWEHVEDELVFSVAGNGFLYHMVRNLVGSLVEVGNGQRSPEDFCELLAARDRRLAGKTAPAAGLYLKEVYY